MGEGSFFAAEVLGNCRVKEIAGLSDVGWLHARGVLAGEVLPFSEQGVDGLLLGCREVGDHEVKMCEGQGPADLSLV